MINDPTVLLAGAIDPKDGVLYIYDEHYESHKPVSYHAKIMNTMLAAAKGNFYTMPVADPKGRANEISQIKSLFDHYREYGILFKAGNNKIQSGIQKVYNYFHLGKLKIMSNCVNTIKEGGNYKYPDLALDKKTNNGDLPVDKDNHSMDSLRYMIQELPDDPNNLKAPKVKHNPYAAYQNLSTVKTSSVTFNKPKEWWI